MTDMLIPGVGAGTLLEKRLLADDRSIRVGAIYRMDFHEAVVLTHDKWKHDAGGIPQYSFLLATARDVADDSFDDDEVLLLRVQGTAPLSMETDLHAVREESLRAALSEDKDASPSVVLDAKLDPFTKNRVSFTGLRCKILGTFYEEDVDGTRQLEFGADVDNFYATSTYRVLKPLGQGLSTIASFLKPNGRPVQQVPLGTVRYSATRRRARAAAQADSTVSINIHDFIGNKTGLLGMTRMGKSNTAKILIARTFVVSERRRKSGIAPIGQLVFDPQGEYANPNVQDGTEIAAIGAEHIRIFKFGADDSKPSVRPLGINFYDADQVDAVQSLIAEKLRSDGAAGYVKDFAMARFADVPGDVGESNRASRGRLVLYAALVKAGFTLPGRRTGAPHRFRASMPGALANKVSPPGSTAKVLQIVGNRGHIEIQGGDNLTAVVQKIIDLKDAQDVDAVKYCDDARWSSTEPIFLGQALGRGVRGWRNLLELTEFHNPNTLRDPAREIYEELLAGKIVIVDLHVGTQSVVTALSESITRHLIKRQTDTFTSGVEPPAIQVMLEEAHNLFSSERYKDDSDVWVKLAKEASKLNMGMTYATQEVSGVAHQVKANTANWVVAHLNNTKEVRELSSFYDFAAYADAIIASEDRGYVRLKTLSSPYIVPVQIDRYDVSLVNDARAAAGNPVLRVADDGSKLS